MSAAEMRWPLRSRKHVEPATPESTLRLKAAKAAAAAFAPGTAAVPRRRRLERVERKRASKRRFAIRTTQAINTLMRVALPTIVASVLGLLYFDNVSLYIRSLLDVGAIGMLMADEAQFVQNFLTVIGLLFSILAGNAYSALYEQQEAIYFALFQEVSEAKSLLEQTTLVCQGRPFYQAALHYIRLYVKRDLRQLDVPPAQLLSSKPMDDPLESIMYITSVGVPSVVYETVKNLRQARGYRLGAMQRKFPALGIGLLYLLAMIELLAFPLLGAGSAGSASILTLQSILFAFLCGAHVLVLRIIQELWQASGGVFNVDEVLQQMVFGLEEELELRSRASGLPPVSPLSAGLPPSSIRADGLTPWDPVADRGTGRMQLSPQQGEVDELRAELRAAIARAEAAEAASAASGARGLSAPQIMRRELASQPSGGPALGTEQVAAHHASGGGVAAEQPAAAAESTWLGLPPAQDGESAEERRRRLARLISKRRRVSLLGRMRLGMMRAVQAIGS
mmetsp:Transcript_3556/g.11414  ORF Transcript_3556/g.11414 Transcript_3556/m.11414 type:complete len:508 (+) Transcript_3556:1-1524(+)